MSLPYKNPITLVQKPSADSVGRNVVYGTSFSVLTIGGYMEVWKLDDLRLTLTASSYPSQIQLSANTIPINFTKGTGSAFSPDSISLNSDNISSGRRRLGMQVFVQETNTVYQYTISNYETLWNNLSGLTGNSAVTQSDYSTIVNNRSAAGKAFINAWTGSTIEGVEGVTKENARWQIFYGSDVQITGGTYYSATTTLDLYNNTGGTVTISGFTGTITGGTYNVGTSTLTLFNSDNTSVSITGIVSGAALQVTDGTTTVPSVTGITFSGAVVTNLGSGNVRVSFSGGTGGSGTSGTSGSSGTSGTSGIAVGANYFFNQSITEVASYKQLSPISVVSAETTDNQTVLNLSTGTTITSYASTPLGFTIIPAGTQRFTLYFSKNAQNDNLKAFIELYVANNSGVIQYYVGSSTPTLIGWNTNNTTPVPVITYIDIASLSVGLTDRLVVVIKVLNEDNQVSSATFYTQGTLHYSYVTTTVGAQPGTSGTSGSSGSSGSSGTSGTSGIALILNNYDNFVITATGTEGTIQGESNLQFDGNNLYLTGDSTTFGKVYLRSDTVTSVGAGTTTILSIPIASGVSANYDYYVTDGTNKRAGTVIAVWDESSTTFTEYSGPSIAGSTTGIIFSTVISGSNVLLRAFVTSGTWTVKVAARVLF